MEKQEAAAGLGWREVSMCLSFQAQINAALNVLARDGQVSNQTLTAFFAGELDDAEMALTPRERVHLAAQWLSAVMSGGVPLPRSEPLLLPEALSLCVAAGTVGVPWSTVRVRAE